MSIIGELLAADNQRDDWYGWLTNQAAHSYLVGIPMGLALSYVLSPYLAALVVVLAYGLGWEVTLQRGKDWCDQIADTFHVGAGALIVGLIASDGSIVAPALIQFAALAYGVARRVRR